MRQSSVFCHNKHGMSRHHLFRVRDSHDHSPVTYVELFFDLVLSSAVPEAFGKTGLMFALAYVGMQLFRTLYMVWASHGVHHHCTGRGGAGDRRNLRRVDP